ncbi:MAG: hypothetical protein RLZZ401_50, partial [Pseudomonadota bacterium]
MKISLIAVHELDDGLQQRWRELQSKEPVLQRPFYHPEFTRLVARHRPGIRIAVLEADNGVCGFLPHELDRARQIQPIGLYLSDYHGLIANFATPVAVPQLLRACGAKYWHFDHMPLVQSALAPFIRMPSVSPVMDIAGGIEAYQARLAEFQLTKTPGVLASTRKSANRLRRDLGPLRFVWDERDPAVLERVMALKSAQWRRTGVADHDAFALPWVRHLMQDGHQLRDNSFCGTLSALYAGDRLVAAHFGFRSDAVLHGSFATYEPDLSYYMPGSLLIQQFAEHGSGQGVSTFDMGRGTQDYKVRFATSMVAMGEGAVSTPQIIATTHLWAQQSKNRVKTKLKSIGWVT